MTVSPPVPGTIKNTWSFTSPCRPWVRFCTRSIFGSPATNCFTSSIMPRIGSIFLDKSLGGILADLERELPSVEKYILIDESGAEPPALPQPALDYEELLAEASERAEFPALDEKMAAGLCYTSGTTGEPKGVLYSHRSTFLHAMAGCALMVAAWAKRRSFSRSCRCFTSTPGDCLTRAPWRGPNRFCRARR